jgi:hypothetical protein
MATTLAFTSRYAPHLTQMGERVGGQNCGVTGTSRGRVWW